MTNQPAPKGAAIRLTKSGLYKRLASDLAKAYPTQYATKEGNPNFFHILGSALKCGFAEVTDDNLESVFEAISARAAGKAHEPPADDAPATPPPPDDWQTFDQPAATIPPAKPAPKSAQVAQPVANPPAPMTSVTIRNSAVMPVAGIAELVARRNAIVQFVQEVMVKGLDYGTIPGTPKPTLYKAGAERLGTMFGLSPEFQAVSVTEDWQGGFFYYHYRCVLSRDGKVIASAEGSCNTKESKYRWRSVDRKCPNCGQSTIIKGKDEYGGGWICFSKKGGCGKKFNAGDQSIESQPAGKVENTEPFDLVNTVQKMAQKRAFVAAILLAVNASEFFTQDIEDLDIIEGNWKEA